MKMKQMMTWICVCFLALSSVQGSWAGEVKTEDELFSGETVAADEPEAEAADSIEASSEDDDDTYQETPREVAEAIMAKENRNGFDDGVNLLIVDGISVWIPAYYALGVKTDQKNTATYYAEKGTGRAAAWISVEPSDYDEKVTMDEISAGILKAYTGAELIQSEPVGIAGYEGLAMTFLYKTLNGSYLYRYAFALDRSNARLIRMYLGETQTVTYSYIPDFDRVIDSAFVSGPSVIGAANVTPELINRLNSIEYYVNELVELRRTINDGQDNEASASAYTKYVSLMEQYETLMNQLTTYGEGELSATDRNYYRQTRDRIRQKLNDAGID